MNFWSGVLVLMLRTDNWCHCNGTTPLKRGHLFSHVASHSLVYQAMGLPM